MSSYNNCPENCALCLEEETLDHDEIEDDFIDDYEEEPDDTFDSDR